MTLSTTEAAQMAGVNQATIRQWHKRGHITPQPGSTPRHPRWAEQDIWRCARDRMPATRRAEIDAAWRGLHTA